MKTLLKQIAGAIAIFAFATTALGASINQTLDGGAKAPNMAVTDRLQGAINAQSTTVDAGEKIAFVLYYALNEGPSASDLRAYIENIDGRTFAAGSQNKIVLQ